MSYEPYVKKGKQQQPQQQQSQSTAYGASAYAAPNTYAPSAYAPSQSSAPGQSSSNAYGTPSSTYNPSAYAPSSTYAPAASTTTPSYSQSTTYSAAPAPSSAYGAPGTGYNAAASTPASTYGAPGSGYSTASSSYGAPGSGYAPASASGGYTPSTGALTITSKDPMKIPEETNNYGSYGNSAYGATPSAPIAPAVAVPVSGMGQINLNNKPSSLQTSVTYQGGPTGGLVSDGHPVQSHKIDYEIKGNDMQIVEIELDPNESVIAEAGGMMFIEEGIDFKTKFGDGSEPKQGFFKKLMSAGGRLLTGESLFVTHFTNTGVAKARVAFAAPYPGTIIPINLADFGGKFICQKDAFLCAALGTKVSIHFNKNIGAGFFGGEGFIMQKLQGDGLAFVHACGIIIRREMRGEKLRVDTGCLVGLTEGITFDIQFSPGLKTMIFGGEGIFLATLQGTGTVWLQSLPFSRMADRIVQSAPSAGGRRVGEGSMLTGGLGGMLDGDGF